MSKNKSTNTVRWLLSVALALCLSAALCVSALAVAEAEKNDSLETANSISTGTEISGSLSDRNDIDWYKFELPEAGVISLTFSHDFVDSSNNYWITKLYSSDNKEIAYWGWKGNATTAEEGSKIGLDAGTYYVRVSDSSHSAATYRFTVNHIPSNTWEKEFNESIVEANSIPTGTEISGSLSDRNDIDWYKFELPEAGVISLTFAHDFVDSSNNYWITKLYSSDNKEIAYWGWKGNATTAEEGSKIGLDAGTYYVRVSDSSHSAATYRFTVNYIPSNTWEKEFNESIVEANSIPTGTEISGALSDRNDIDWYKFELPEAGVISLTFSHDFVDSSNNYWITKIYSSDNKEIASWGWKGNATAADTGSEIGVAAGTYYVRVSDSSHSSATYRFTVNFKRSGSSGDDRPPVNPGPGDDKPPVNPGPGDGDSQPVYASRVTLSKTNLSLTVGETAGLTASVTPSNTTDKTIVWKSGNSSVATVRDGKVTGVGEGSTTITATCGSVSAQCTVVVKAEDSQTPGGEPATDVGVHFERVTIYFQDQFTDVPANQWYTSSVAEAFELGLMTGTSKTAFNPYGDVTVAEAVTMAARIHSIYTNDQADFSSNGGDWYQPYREYAYENGIISRAYYNCDASRKASRAQFAEILANCLPPEALAAINTVESGAIPDVSANDSYALSVYTLYRAGVLAGSDANGTFNPSTYITRAEAAAIVSRMAESNNRISITFTLK